VSESLGPLFRDVDASGQAEGLARYLDDVETVLGPHKRAAVQALALSPGDHVIDIGCGTGDDVRRMAALVAPDGAATGVDASRELLAEARRRSSDVDNVRFTCGDAHALPFSDGSFRAALIDRVLMHVERPSQAIAEAVRVLAPGGRLAVIEPDWDLVAIDAEPLASTRAVVRAMSDQQRHGTIGRTLPRRCADAGLEVIAVIPQNWLVRDLRLAEALGGLSGIARSALGAAAEEWLACVRERDRAGRLLVALTAFLVVGRRPPP
jgi:SAM-dependent methyltransferase